jgi:small-conductance mechanosensitive channel
MPQEGFSSNVFSASGAPTGVPKTTAPESASVGGTNEGVSEAIANEMPNVDESTEVAEVTERMPEEAASTQPKLVPETDLNKLRSTYDKKVSDLSKQFDEASKQNAALLAQQQEFERQIFEMSISQLPPDQQTKQRESFQIEQERKQMQAALQAEQMQRAFMIQQLEPVFKEVTVQKISETYKVPRTIIEEELTPAAMEAAAKAYLKATKQAQGQVRKAAKVDTFESGGGSAVKPDIIKDYRGSGKIQDYLRAKRTMN